MQHRIVGAGVEWSGVGELAPALLSRTKLSNDNPHNCRTSLIDVCTASVYNVVAPLAGARLHPAWHKEKHEPCSASTNTAIRTLAHHFRSRCPLSLITPHTQEA